MKHPEAAAFVRDVMKRVGAKNATELSKTLGPPWTERDQQRKIYKWVAGEVAPNFEGTLALLEVAGMLRKTATVRAARRSQPQGLEQAVEQLRQNQEAALALLEELTAAAAASASANAANAQRLDALRADLDELRTRLEPPRSKPAPRGRVAADR